ncbi:chaperone modulator CbpM [Anabaena cylindrica UHCC 0172]|uniref:chaperone modulator CbpM n=1 Tax=Anabaena cylindrica TaxID=1165 RepID=UPI002B1EA159|nr:chaperone modulator CbpM [Anabaena cylindrica]MEA5549598.1 chaperone modulator CbpM [Anabaena cylindrica UHCC 0172]
MTFSLSKTVVSLEGEQLYSFEYAALITKTSITVVQVYVELGVIEPIGDLLHSREITRIAQIQRLRQDLGLNLVGAAMVLDMTAEIAQLRAQLKVYQSH